MEEQSYQKRRGWS